MNSLDPAEVTALLISAPAWARHCLGVNDEALRLRAATEIADLIVNALGARSDTGRLAPIESPAIEPIPATASLVHQIAIKS